MIVKICGACQRSGNIGRRNKMRMNTILELEVFDGWGMDFMGSFLSSFGNRYILVAYNYVSKWVEAFGISYQRCQSCNENVKVGDVSKVRDPKSNY